MSNDLFFGESPCSISLSRPCLLLCYNPDNELTGQCADAVRSLWRATGDRTTSLHQCADAVRSLWRETGDPN